MAAYASSPYNSSHVGAATGPAGSWPDPHDTSRNGGQSASYPHLKDLKDSVSPNIERDAPLAAQLALAEEYIRTSKRSIEFRRLDIAYKEYVKGYEVAVNYIPDHRDYGFTCDNNKPWQTRHRALCRTIQDMEGKIEEVKRVIQEDNVKSGVQPRANVLAAQPRRSYPSETHVLEPSEAPRPQSSGGRPSSSHRGDSKPVPRPKPDNLHGIAVGTSTSELAQRFAQLRTPSAGPGTLTQLPMPNAADFQTTSTERPQSYSAQSPKQSNGVPATRPGGPRDMPVTTNGPSIPPKLPIMPTSISMPQAPSPTYSPVKVSNASGQPASTRSSTDSARPSTGKRQTYYNQPIIQAQTPQLQRTRDENPYRPRTPNGVNSAIIAKSSSSEIPPDNAISAQTLKDYMKKYNVLIIDVRPREEFDEGHIFSSSILCIEPISLKEGVSADELEDRLIVSPDAEQLLFSRRNEFDIVVYYDQNTSSTAFTKGPPTGNNTPALRALFDTLFEFNEYKALKDGRPPALLLGGIEAWVDLMGSGSLAESKTAGMLLSAQQRRGLTPGKPIPRQRMASANSSLEVRRRRLREYQPLNPDEEHAWRQRAQQEELDERSYVPEPSEGEQSDSEGIETPSPFVHDYESFLRKFPEVGVQQSMTMPVRPREPIVRPLNERTPSSERTPAYARPQYEPALPAIPSRPPPAIPRPSYSGQAEIIQSQASLSRVSSASRPPLYSSASVARRMKLPRTGLTNFGVTCYMNATLQCLSATTPLSQFFLEDQYKQFVRKNWKGSSGIMPGLYSTVVRSLWGGDVEVIKPTTFRNFCGRMNREWAIDRQQDAKEFFDFLVDCLHEDLNVNWDRSPLRPLTPAEEMRREKMPFTQASPHEWDRFLHRDFSFISSLFAGQHASRLRCRTCNNTSTTWEAFYSISIEIPKSGQGDIHSCLRSYTKEEMLSGDEVWKCPYCKCEREATKQIILTRLPQFLVIHFKRFSASKTESARKIHTPIDFPLYGLNLDEFVVAKPTPIIAAEADSGADLAPPKFSPDTTRPFNYDAYGVLRHLGNTGNGGHYVSMVKDPGRGVWRKYDDERSFDFEPMKLSAKDRLTNGEAYIVFYQRAVAR